MANATTKDIVTVRELYTLVDQKMGQVNASIQRIETKFDNLETGRLTILEKEFANLQGKLTVVAAIISIAISTFFLIINIFLKK